MTIFVQKILNFLYRFRNKGNTAIGKILFLFPSSAVGDTVVETFFIKEVKKLFPHAILDVFILAPSAVLLQNNPNVNKIITMPVNKYMKLFYLGYKSFFFRFKKYDLLIDVPHSGYAPFRYILLYFIGAKQTMSCNIKGYDFITHPVFWEENLNHITEEVYIKALKTLGAREPFKVEYQLCLNNNLNLSVDTFIKQHNLFNKKILLINPEASKPAKTISNMKTVEIITALKKNINIKIVLLSYKKKYSSLDKDIILFKSNDLLETAYLISKVDYVLTVDTGIVYIADIFNKDMTVLYSLTIINKPRPFVSNFWGSKKMTNKKINASSCVDEIKTEQIIYTIKKHMSERGN